MAVDTNYTAQSGNGEANTVISLAVAAVANGLALAQTPAAAGNLLLNGGLIVAGAYTGTGARRLVIASDSAADLQTVTFFGTDRAGNALQETVTLTGAATITTVNDFLTVTRILFSAAATGNITVGTSQKGSGAWIPIERYRNNPISLAVIGQIISGAVNFTLEHTYDDPNTPAVAGTLQVPVPFPQQLVNNLQVGDAVPATAFADATIVNKAATTEGTVVVPFVAVRWTVNSGVGVLKGQIRAAAMASGMR